MTMMNRTRFMIVALLLCGAAPALAQSTFSAPQHVPLEKTIGQAGPEIVPSLIVINARGASLQGGQLTLTGVAPNSIIFADRPVRAAGHSLATHLLEEWSPSNASDESFAKDPPNATISVFSQDGSKIRDAVVVLKTSIFGKIMSSIFGHASAQTPQAAPPLPGETSTSAGAGSPPQLQPQLAPPVRQKAPPVQPWSLTSTWRPFSPTWPARTRKNLIGGARS